jgi:serralysin
MAQLNGTDGADRLVGGAAGDSLLGLGGADTLEGGAGNDTINGGAGDDAVAGGTGADTYVLSLGRGSLVVTSPSDGVFTLRPAASGLVTNFGVDTVSGVESFQIVASHTTVAVPAAEMMARFNFGYSHAATAGNDKLLGSYGADTINGGAGDDTVEGGYGNDRLAGGAGADVLRGNAGADVFVFRAWEGANDRIEDFEVGLDRIETHGDHGYVTWASEGTDAGGRQGTWVTWGWNTDTVFLPGVTGVGVDALLA